MIAALLVSSADVRPSGRLDVLPAGCLHVLTPRRLDLLAARCLDPCEVLDLSVAALKGRLHRARLFLRRELSDYVTGRHHAPAAGEPR